MSSEYTKVITKSEFLDRLEAGRWDLEVPAPYLLLSTRGDPILIGLAQEGSPHDTVYDATIVSDNVWRQFKVIVPRDDEGLRAAFQALAEVHKLRRRLSVERGSDLDRHLVEVAKAAVEGHLTLETAYVVLDV